MKVLSLGPVARHIMGRDQEARLMGSTSRGVFLRTTSAWVLYLTPERPRGPLTINLDQALDGLREQPGDAVSIRAEGLGFPKSRLWISSQGVEAWSPLPCTRAALPLHERLARLEEVAGLVRVRSELFPQAAWDSLAQALHHQDAAQIAAVFLSRFLGCGPGLTPAGDDVAVGLLLALGRWRHCLLPGFPFEELCSRLVQAAQSKITTLSANLLECAGQGLADERLITGLDGLVTGGSGVADLAACFNGWGSSSGGMAFEGIRLVISCQVP